MASLSFGDRAGRSFWRLMPKRALSGVIGWGTRGTLPRGVRKPFLTRFARHYDIDIAEAEKPIEEYDGFDDFFTRRLRADARPVDMSPGVVVNPADGTVVESGIIEAGQLIQAKGVLFSLADLLTDVGE